MGSKIRGFITRKKVQRAATILILLIVGFFAVRFFTRPVAVATNSGDRLGISDAKASMDINREFSFPLKNSKGEEISKIKYFIEKAEIRDQIIVKGKRVSAVKGRTFLVLNLKITNEYNQAIEITTRDYVRLSINENESEWLAPEVHNDPVSVQPISTKLTRVAFPVNETDSKFVLQVGEVEGTKEKLPLSL